MGSVMETKVGSGGVRVQLRMGDKDRVLALSDRQVAAIRRSLLSFVREPFTRRPKARLPEVVAVAGSNYAEVGFAVGKRTVTCFAAIDNLIKGGAGQAIQNMNLVLGCDEKASLEDVGNWP